jgi:hypothetical protein
MLARFRGSLAIASRIWPVLAIYALAALVTCSPPKGEGYRRVELFSAGNSQIEFTCLIGCHSYDTFVGTTPWKLELDLDTMDECIGGTRCRVLRSDPGQDRLWVWAFDRDSLRLDKYLASPSDTVFFHMRSWICDQGKP